MGTNYYLTKNGPTVHEPVHIGKSSLGWLFLFCRQDDPWWRDPAIIWNNYEQVKDTLKKLTVDSNEYVIINEYDDIVPYDEFVALVDAKQNDPYCKDNPYNFKGRDIDNVNGYRFTKGEFS